MNKTTSTKSRGGKPRGSVPQSESATRSHASNITTAKPSKQAKIVAMLVSEAGATLPVLVEATGWQSHTVRASLTGLRKRGYAITSDKVDGVRTYRAVAPE
ncbi:MULTISPECIES: DUF3489 domain-containing protein [Sphingomonas]|uniref:DUF3489 domain-containing protein n=1 Tax=Sphingomonas TaxID=13687 RepID=UPI0013B3799D|nr:MULTISPECIES: DUF3489 domain-containing protein [Sphingomonas]